MMALHRLVATPVIQKRQASIDSGKMHGKRNLPLESLLLAEERTKISVRLISLVSQKATFG
jgi:hypothetical protein